YTLSLHDALPIYERQERGGERPRAGAEQQRGRVPYRRGARHLPGGGRHRRAGRGREGGGNRRAAGARAPGTADRHRGTARPRGHHHGQQRNSARGARQPGIHRHGVRADAGPAGERRGGGGTRGRFAALPGAPRRNPQDHARSFSGGRARGQSRTERGGRHAPPAPQRGLPRCGQRGAYSGRRGFHRSAELSVRFRMRALLHNSSAHSDFIEVQSFPFDSECALLLCSDGLSDQVPAADIRAAVERHAGNPEGTVRELIAAANRAGGKDNVTVLVVEGEQFTATAVPAAVAARSPWISRALLFAAGIVAAAALGWLTRTMWQPAPVVMAPRVIAVTTTIAAAMAGARAGDSVEGPEGEYREQVRLKDGVTLRARVPREPKLRAAPMSNGPAVIAEGVKGARLSGFRILADAEAPLSIGILLRESAVEIDDVE